MPRVRIVPAHTERLSHCEDTTTMRQAASAAKHSANLPFRASRHWHRPWSLLGDAYAEVTDEGQ
jgi:hypothetical protein